MIGASVARWVFKRPRWLFPLRLALLVWVMVVAANLTAAPTTAGHHHVTTTTTHGRGLP
jgi:hypothetical protein